MDRPPPSSTVGAACNDHNDCSQYCARGGDFPGGFCTIQGCRTNEHCPEGTVCVSREDGICLYPCREPLDCASGFIGRGGYGCNWQSAPNTGDTSSIRYRVCIGN